MKRVISWKDVNIKVSSKCELDNNKLLIPYYKLSEDIDAVISKELVVELAEKNEIIWYEDKERMIFKVKKINDEVYKAIIVLINVLIKLELQERGMYILHASSVMVDDRALLLFGSSGSGKTATSMHLGLNKKAAFISNGSTVVAYDGKESKVVGTYKTGIKIRKSTLMQYDATLCDEIFGTAMDNNDYDQKIVLNPEEMHIINGEEKLGDINKIELYIIQLDSTNREAKLKIEYDYKVAMQIYEDLVREIDCAEVCVCLDNHLVYVPTLDNEILYRKRISFINDFMEKHFAGMLMGGLDEVCETLLNKGK